MDIKTINSLDELRTVMRDTEQMPGLSVLGHGEQVANYFDDLKAHVLQETPLAYDWRLPDWVNEPVLWSNLPDNETITRYQVYHDCGKPFCRTVDEQGRSHFPDHAQMSHDVWLQLTGEEEIATLMQMDMDVHLLKGADVPTFTERPQAALLLLTGLCEVHANAAMFGGLDSTSFKIKWKHLNRRGKAIVRQLQNTHKEISS